jgi:hypothetical protein
MLDEPLHPDLLARLEPIITTAPGAQSPSGLAYALAKYGVIRLCQREASAWGAARSAPRFPVSRHYPDCDGAAGTGTTADDADAHRANAAETAGETRRDCLSRGFPGECRCLLHHGV